MKFLFENLTTQRYHYEFFLIFFACINATLLHIDNTEMVVENVFGLADVVNGIEAPDDTALFAVWALEERKTKTNKAAINIALVINSG